MLFTFKNAYWRGCVITTAICNLGPQCLCYINNQTMTSMEAISGLSFAAHIFNIVFDLICSVFNLKFVGAIVTLIILLRCLIVLLNLSSSVPNKCI